MPFVSIPRHVKDTPLWRKPPAWLKTWLWLMMRNPFGPDEGKGFVINWLKVREAVPELTPDGWARFLRWARETGLLTLTRVDNNNNFRVVLSPLPKPPPVRHANSPDQQLDLLHDQQTPPTSTEDNPPPPEDLPKPRRGPTWLTPYGTLWESIMGAPWVSWKAAAKYLGPLHNAHGTATVSRHMENYLRTVGAQYVTLARFAETFGKWTARGAPSGLNRKATDANDHSDYT